MKLEFKKLGKKKEIIIMVIIGIIYFFAIGKSGYVIERDSSLYMNFSEGKFLSPLYALFLLVAKNIFGIQGYLSAVYIMQGILAILCSIYLTMSIKKEMELKQKETIFIYILSFLPYAWTLPEYVCSHSIFTEAFTFPLFYIFFVCIYRSVLKKEIKEANKALMVILILCLFRLQMIFLLGIYASVLVYILWMKSRNKRFFFQTLAIFFVIFLMLTLLVFNKTGMTDTFNQHLANLIFGKVMYVADEDDIKLMPDDITKEIFRNTYKKISEEGFLLEKAQKGLWKWKDLKSSIEINQIAYEIIVNKSGTENITHIRKSIALPLFKDNFIKYIYVLVLLIPESLMCALFIQKPNIYLFCYLFTFIIYFTAILFCFWRKKKINYKIRNFLLITLLILTLNILVTNFVMFGLQRYLVYTYGLFYIGYYLAIKELFGEKIIQMITKGKKRKNEEIVNYNTGL